MNHHINDRSQAYVNFYFGQDFLKGGSSEFSVGDNITPFENKDFGKMRWGNIALSSGWSYVFNNKMFGTVTLAYSHYQSKLKQETSQLLRNRGWQRLFFTVYRDLNPKRYQWFRSPCELRLYSYLAHHIRYGTDYLYHRFSPEYIEEKTSENLSPNQTNYRRRAPFSEWVAVSPKMTGDISHCPANAGLRLNMYNIQKKTYVSLDPRLSVRFLLTRDLSLKAHTPDESIRTSD